MLGRRKSTKWWTAPSRSAPCPTWPHWARQTSSLRATLRSGPARRLRGRRQHPHCAHPPGAGLQRPHDGHDAERGQDEGLAARTKARPAAGGLLESCEGGSVWGIRARRGLLLVVQAGAGSFARQRILDPVTCTWPSQTHARRANCKS